MKLVSDGKAPKIPQTEEGATYDPMLNKKELCKINWDQSAEAIHNFIRGLDSSPGAWTVMDGKEVRSLWCVGIMRYSFKDTDYVKTETNSVPFVTHPTIHLFSIMFPLVGVYH